MIGSDGNSAHVFSRAGGSWTDDGALAASGLNSTDRFGVAVAVDADGVAVVGAPGQDVGAVGSGSVYLFHRDQGAGWGQTAVFSGSAVGQELGTSVSVEEDVVVAGSAFDGGASQGSVSVYRNGGAGLTDWSFSQTLAPVDLLPGDQFGRSVALSEGILIVGAPGRNSSMYVNVGIVYVFTDGGASFTQLATTTAPDPDHSNIYFGWAVALDQGLAVVGAYQYNSPQGGVGPATISESGAAYILEQDLGGSNQWNASTRLLASNAGIGDDFGFVVSINGTTVAVGAHGEDGPVDTTFPGSGAVYIFERPSGTWVQRTIIRATTPEALDEFGWGLAVLGSGEYVIGAPGDDGPANAGTERGSISWVSHCSETGRDPASDCTGCAEGFFGASCSPCPDCGLNGECNDGLTGDGVCACDAGWFGATCVVQCQDGTILSEDETECVPDDDLGQSGDPTSTFPRLWVALAMAVCSFMICGAFLVLGRRRREADADDAVSSSVGLTSKKSDKSSTGTRSSARPTGDTDERASNPSANASTGSRSSRGSKKRGGSGRKAAGAAAAAAAAASTASTKEPLPGPFKESSPYPEGVDPNIGIGRSSGYPTPYNPTSPKLPNAGKPMRGGR